jgi:hypothetical protein
MTPGTPGRDTHTHRTDHARLMAHHTATQDRAAAVLAEHFRAAVDSFPPLTRSANRIAALLHARGNEETTPASQTAR